MKIYLSFLAGIGFATIVFCHLMEKQAERLADLENAAYFEGYRTSLEHSGGHTDSIVEGVAR